MIDEGLFEYIDARITKVLTKVAKDQRAEKVRVDSEIAELKRCVWDREQMAAK